MYANAAAISRPEISAFLEEAQAAEKAYIAKYLMPIYTAQARAGRYPKLRISAGELLKAQSTLRHATGTYDEVQRKWEWDTYDCVDRGLTERIDDVLMREMKSFFELEVLTGKLVMRAMLLDYEQRCASLLMNSGTFTATASKVAYTEGNLATIDFPYDVTEAIARMEARAQAPNTMVMSRAVFNRLRRSTLLQTFLWGQLGTGAGSYRLINQEDFAKAFGLENVFVAAATVDTAEKGAAASMSPVWGNTFVGLFNVQGGDFAAGGIGRTIVWGADTPGGLFVSETYREEQRRGNVVRVRSNTAEKIIDATAGELITTQYA